MVPITDDVVVDGIRQHPGAAVPTKVKEVKMSHFIPSPPKIKHMQFLKWFLKRIN